MKVALACIKEQNNAFLDMGLMEEKLIEAAYNGADIVFFKPNSLDVDMNNEDFLDLINYCGEYAITVGIGIKDNYQVYDYKSSLIFEQKKRESFIFEKIKFYVANEKKDSYTLLIDNNLESDTFLITDKAYYHDGEIILESDDILYFKI